MSPLETQKRERLADLEEFKLFRVRPKLAPILIKKGMSEEEILKTSKRSLWQEKVAEIANVLSVCKLPFGCLTHGEIKEVKQLKRLEVTSLTALAEQKGLLASRMKTVKGKKQPCYLTTDAGRSFLRKFKRNLLPVWAQERRKLFAE